MTDHDDRRPAIRVYESVTPAGSPSRRLAPRHVRWLPVTSAGSPSCPLAPRHARPWGGHPRLHVMPAQFVDGRVRPGHDGKFVAMTKGARRWCSVTDHDDRCPTIRVYESVMAVGSPSRPLAPRHVRPFPLVMPVPSPSSCPSLGRASTTSCDASPSRGWPGQARP